MLYEENILKDFFIKRDAELIPPNKITLHPALLKKYVDMVAGGGFEPPTFGL
jgi:hypothetical protein